MLHIQPKFFLTVFSIRLSITLNLSKVLDIYKAVKPKGGWFMITDARLGAFLYMGFFFIGSATNQSFFKRLIKIKKVTILLLIN